MDLHTRLCKIRDYLDIHVISNRLTPCFVLTLWSYSFAKKINTNWDYSPPTPQFDWSECYNHKPSHRSVILEHSLPVGHLVPLYHSSLVLPESKTKQVKLPVSFIDVCIFLTQCVNTW